MCNQDGIQWPTLESAIFGKKRQYLFTYAPFTKCFKKMKIISFIENEEVIKKILKHLGLWGVKARPPPRANVSQPDVHIDYSARPGATRLPVAAQTMHYSKHDFLRIQCW